MISASPAEQVISASPAERRRIEHERRRRRWSSGDDSQALVEASKNLILGYSVGNRQVPGLLSNTELTLSRLEALIVEGKVAIPRDREQQGWVLYRQFEQEVRQSSEGSFSKERLEQLIESRGLRAANITYRTWSDFRSGNPLEQSTFIAYWEALEFDQKQIGRERREELYKVLTETFDYQAQKESFIRNLRLNPPLRVGAFLIQERCRYSRIWLMRRLEGVVNQSEVQSEIEPKRIRLNLEKLNTLKLREKLKCELRIPIFEILKKQHLILIFENVDSLDRGRFKKFLDEIWIPEVNAIQQESQSPEYFLIAFLVDHGTSNDWRNQDDFLNPEVVKIPRVNLQDFDIRCGMTEILARLDPSQRFSNFDQMISYLLQPLAFWWKWYCKIQNDQPLNAETLDLWFISLVDHLISRRAETPALVLRRIYEVVFGSEDEFNQEERWQRYP